MLSGKFRMSRTFSAEPSRVVVARSWKACALWLVLGGALTAAIWPVFARGEQSVETPLALGAIAIFVAQGFLAEFLGVRANEQAVSFPRRLFPFFPFPTLWRRQIRTRQISRVDSWGENAVRVYLGSAELVDINLPDATRKRVFLNFLDPRNRKRSR